MNVPKRRFFACYVVVLASLAASLAFGQPKGTIEGKVTSAKDGSPLPGANVSIIGTLLGASGDADGEFEIKVIPGVYRVRATFIGYRSAEKAVTVSANQTSTLDFQLQPSALEFNEVVIEVGSRTRRTVLETPVPVDVLTSTEIRKSGETEINQIIRTIAPSFNASHQTISDGTDHVNPASLRGLGPDQVLVLINGKRRHQSALMHVNGTFGRGTVGVDLNSIPKSAIERIEVLRDGAAAQYGSDAIAGVINIVLKQQVNELQVNSQAGVTGEGDGEQYFASGNYGFAVGNGGYFNVTAEFLDRGRTNRSGIDTRDFFPGISGTEATNAELARRGLTREDFSMKIGQGNATVGNVFFNTAIPLASADAQFYAFGGLTHRRGDATGFYRRPNQESQVNLNVYPNGFLPEIHTVIDDDAWTAGLRGNRNGWDIDLSVTHGGNGFQFNIENSINASMGESSPTSFDAGRLKFRQTTGNLDIVRPIDTKGAVNSLSLVLGSEFRVENYQIIAGEDASWTLGNGNPNPVPGVDFDTTSSGSPKNPGSQVFPGFQPDNEVNRFRNSISAYAGLESQLSDQFSLDVGGRFENYSDFGNTVIGKLAARFEPVNDFALRGAVSTGFRAPSLHQLWFNNVSIQFVFDENNNLVPSRVLTSENNSPITEAFGIPPLKEETSVSFSAGFTARPSDNFSITADGYLITIDDRIVFTSRFTDADPIVADILSPFASLGVGQAQFFANAVDTETKGIDVVANYSTFVGDGRLTLTGAANITDTKVDTTNIPEGVAAIFAGGDLDAVRNTLFNREERNRLETALPRQKFLASARYSVGKFSGLVRATYYGEVLYRPTNPANDEDFSPKTLIDVDLSVEILKGVDLVGGAVNLFNTFPDEHEKEANRSNERFPYSRRVTQFGINGGFYYGGLRFNL